MAKGSEKSKKGHLLGETPTSAKVLLLLFGYQVCGLQSKPHCL